MTNGGVGGSEVGMNEFCITKEFVVVAITTLLLLTIAPLFGAADDAGPLSVPVLGVVILLVVLVVVVVLLLVVVELGVVGGGGDGARSTHRRSADRRRRQRRALAHRLAATGVTLVILIFILVFTERVAAALVLAYPLAAG